MVVTVGQCHYMGFISSLSFPHFELVLFRLEGITQPKPAAAEESTESRLPSWDLSIPTAGDSTASLGDLLQCVTSLMVKKGFKGFLCSVGISCVFVPHSSHQVLWHIDVITPEPFLQAQQSLLSHIVLM